MVLIPLSVPEVVSEPGRGVTASVRCTSHERSGKSDSPAVPVLLQDLQLVRAVLNSPWNEGEDALEVFGQSPSLVC